MFNDALNVEFILYYLIKIHTLVSKITNNLSLKKKGK